LETRFKSQGIWCGDLTRGIIPAGQATINEMIDNCHDLIDRCIEQCESQGKDTGKVKEKRGLKKRTEQAAIKQQEQQQQQPGQQKSGEQQVTSEGQLTAAQNLAGPISRETEHAGPGSTGSFESNRDIKSQSNIEGTGKEPSESMLEGGVRKPDIGSNLGSEKQQLTDAPATPQFVKAQKAEHEPADTERSEVDLPSVGHRGLASDVPERVGHAQDIGSSKFDYAVSEGEKAFDPRRPGDHPSPSQHREEMPAEM
jgi:hypothetical protein